MEHKLKFWLVLGWLAVLNTAQPNVLLATFEGIYFMYLMAKKFL